MLHVQVTCAIYRAQRVGRFGKWLAICQSLPHQYYKYNETQNNYCQFVKIFLQKALEVFVHQKFPPPKFPSYGMCCIAIARMSNFHNYLDDSTDLMVIYMFIVENVI